MIETPQRIVALVLGLALLLFIVDLVRRRRLKEEYSVLWVATAVVILVLAVWTDALVWITHRIGGIAPSSTLFLFGLLFAFFMLLHFSLRVSDLERRLMALVQEVGLMTARPPEPDPPDPPDPPEHRGEPRTAVVVPCFNDGALVSEAVASVQEEEPVEIVVVDDGSTDAETARRLAALAGEGVRVLRQENAGPAAARTAGLAATRAPFVFALDADDVLVPGALGAMADALERHPDAGFAWGDYILFGSAVGRYRSPDRWLPWTLTYVNPYPGSSMFRRETLERAGGWQGSDYEDWDLWLRLVDLGIEGIPVDRAVFCYRQHGDGRRQAQARPRHQALYAELQRRHTEVFASRDALRRGERPAAWKRAVYPVLFGRRGVVPLRVETFLQRMMMRMGTGLPR